MTNKLWNQIRNFYNKRFNIEPTLVDIAADLQILRLCVNGASNDSISQYMNMDYVDIVDTINKYFDGFYGWENELSHSPLKMYNEGRTLSYTETKICEKYLELEKRLDKEWI